MAQRPKYSLKIVQDIIRRNNPETIWFSAPSRSLHEVIRVYSNTDLPKSLSEATEFICAGILELTDQNFVECVFQWDVVVADVYGLIFDGRPWYVKFVLENDVLEEISFHPPQKSLFTVGGLEIPAEVKI